MTATNNHWTTNDIPDQSGKVAIVTGANSGIGYEAARALTHKGATTILACRSAAKGEAAAERIQTEKPKGTAVFLSLDLAEMASVRRFVEVFNGRYDRLNMLINNAGVMVPPYGKTADGFEQLANLLFTYELQRKLQAAKADAIAVAAHPGWAATNLQKHSRMINFSNRFLAQSSAMGALPTLRAATAPDVRGGEYYGPGRRFGSVGYPKKVRSNGRSHDKATAAKLWAISEEMTGVTVD